MWKLQLAELRGSWSTWLGVSLAFIVCNFTLMLSALAYVAGERAIRTGGLDPEDSTAFVVNPAMNFIFCAVIGAVVIGTATSMVLNARRGALARLALSGATPLQISTTSMIQLAIVSLICSLVGAALAAIALVPTLNYLAIERLEAGTPMPTPEPVYSVWPILLATGIAIGVALLGGFRQVVANSRVAPVEALREHASDGIKIRMTAWRWIGVVSAIIMIIVVYGSIPIITETPDKETISNLFLASMVLLIIAAVTLALLAPVIVGPLTRAWTSLMPVKSASWQLARRTVTARASRLTRSVVPVMMTIGLMLGMLTQFGSIEGILVANGFDFNLSATGPATLLVFLGLPLLISLAGGVGSLIMMSRQRDAELALLGVVGATPKQRVIIPTLEALIINGTGLLMALIMVVVAIGVLAIGIPAAGFNFTIIFPLVMFIATLSVTLLVTTSAIVLPTLRARKQPEPGVIARLVAE